MIGISYSQTSYIDLLIYLQYFGKKQWLELDVAQDRDTCWPLVNAVMKFRFP